MSNHQTRLYSVWCSQANYRMLLAWEELTHLPECIKAILRGEGGVRLGMPETSVVIGEAFCVIDPSAFDPCVLPGCVENRYRGSWNVTHACLGYADKNLRSGSPEISCQCKTFCIKNKKAIPVCRCLVCGQRVDQGCCGLTTADCGDPGLMICDGDECGLKQTSIMISSHTLAHIRYTLQQNTGMKSTASSYCVAYD